MMDINGNRVGAAIHSTEEIKGSQNCRNAYCVDRVREIGHGVEFPRSRGLRIHMVNAIVVASNLGT